MASTLDLQLLWSPVGLFLLGLCAGSFINVVVRRLPVMMMRQWWWDTSMHLQSGEGLNAAVGPHGESERGRERRLELAHELLSGLQAQPELGLAHPRSHCPACGHPLRWFENLPVVGWLLLKGRCSSCGVRISPRYPLVELATGLLFVAAGMRFGEGPQALLWSAWAAGLLAMALLDWDTTLLPDTLTLPLIWCGLSAAALGWTLPLQDAVWGVVWGFGGLWIVVETFERITGKEAMGGGDLKLLAGLGAWLGPEALLPVVFIASLAGAVAGLVMRRRDALREGRFVPFGPFLAGAAGIVAFIGVAPILGWVGLP